MKRLGYTFVTPSTGGHWANEFASAMEEYGAYSPDTAEELAPISVTFTAPPSGAVWVQLSCDIFTQTAGTEHGYFGLKIAGGSSISGTKKEVSSAGPNAKRRVTYSHRITGLTPTTSYSYTWEWMADGADDVRSNQSDSTFTRPMFEVWEIELAPGGADATANPGVAAATTTVPQAGPQASVSITPATVAGTVSAPQASAGAGTTVTPAVIARSFSVPQVAQSAASSVTPATVARSFTVPQVTVTAGGNATAFPDVIARSVVIPQAEPRAAVSLTPATIARAVTVPQVTVSAGTDATPTPAVIARAFTIPQATKTATAAPTPEPVLVVVSIGASVAVVPFTAKTITREGTKSGGAASGTVKTITREGVSA